MVSLILGILLFFQSPDSSEVSYYYFGSTNFIGKGLVDEDGKTGEWLIYEQKIPEADPQPSLAKADPNYFLKNFNTNSPRFSISFSHDEPNGLFQEFYPDGKIRIINNFKEGISDGEFYQFFNNGEIEISGQYLNGKKHGEWSEFYPDGTKKSTYVYSFGLLSWDAFSYFPDGKLQWKLPYRQGELDGEYSFYYSSGILEERGNYKSGSREGEFIQFFPDSTRKSQGEFLEGKQTGIWKSWNQKGELIFEGEFKNGEADGEWIEQVDIYPEYYRKGAYKAGLKEGEWNLVNSEGEVMQTEFYEKGRLLSLSDFQINGQIFGEVKLKGGKGKRTYFDQDGNKIAEGRIKDGFRNGFWYIYYPKSDRVSSSGKYIGKEQVGTWTYFTYNGAIRGEKDFGKIGTFGQQARIETRQSVGFERFSRTGPDIKTSDPIEGFSDFMRDNMRYFNIRD